MGTSGEPHNWCDKKHMEPFKHNAAKSGDDESIKAVSASEKLHTGVESFVKLQIKNGISLSPNDILENMKKERPQIFKFFKPTIE